MTILTPDAFLAAAERQFHLGEAPIQPYSDHNGDHRLNPGTMPLENPAQARPAAVLIPVVARPAPTVLLTQRSSELPDHAGQIAFPGGKIDKIDATPLDAALREAEEEIGLDRQHVRPIGYLDHYYTGSGYRITPVLALVDPRFSLAVNAGEVHDVFEVPLAFLMNADNHQRHSRVWKGRERFYLAMPYGERYIWGATAGILRHLYERLAE